MVRLYMLTIKNNQARHASIAELDRALALARGSIQGADFHDFVGYEPDSLRRMHLHTMFRTPNQISCKKYNKILNHDSWQFHLQPICMADFDKVRGYCMKNRCPELSEEYCSQYWFEKNLPRIV